MSAPTRPLIICPTYNERDNIAPLVERVTACAPQAALLFVDDRGNDDTATQIERCQQQHRSIFLLRQPQQGGLAKAYLAGFAWGLARPYDCFVTMDADLSHNPEHLPTLVHTLSNCDVAIGSRYIAGGGVGDWSTARQLMSRAGSWYARTLLKLKVQDPTSGFVAFSRKALEALNLSTIKSRGYVLQVELKYRALLAGCTLRETPIVFADRKQGKSKMSLAIAIEGALYIWHLRRLGRQRQQTTPMLL